MKSLRSKLQSNTVQAASIAGINIAECFTVQTPPAPIEPEMFTESPFQVPHLVEPQQIQSSVHQRRLPCSATSVAANLEKRTNRIK